MQSGIAVSNESAPAMHSHMSMVRTLSRAILACVAAAAASHAHGVNVVPLGYTAPAAYPSYPDDTGNQLTDGVTGINEYSYHSGYEWVAWSSDVAIKFSFRNEERISQVKIGFNRNEGVGIFLPTTVVINGVSFPLNGDEIGDVKRGWLTFKGPFVGDTITVELIDGNSNKGTWVDEFQFASPEIEGTAKWQTAHTVKCENLTAGTNVVIAKTKSANWNCEDSGLVVNSGDTVRVTIDGKKY